MYITHWPGMHGSHRLPSNRLMRKRPLPTPSSHITSNSVSNKTRLRTRPMDIRGSRPRETRPIISRAVRLKDQLLVDERLPHIDVLGLPLHLSIGVDCGCWVGVGVCCCVVSGHWGVGGGGCLHVFLNDFFIMKSIYLITCIIIINLIIPIILRIRIQVQHLLFPLSLTLPLIPQLINLSFFHLLRILIIVLVGV